MALLVLLKPTGYFVEGFVMRRPRLRWVLALAALAVAAVLVGVLWPPRPERITQKNFDLLRVGMSKPEVYALLGPPGLHLTRDVDAGDGGETFLGDAPNYANKKGVEKWNGDEVLLWVQFDSEGHVVGATCIPTKTHDHGMIGNVWWRIKYQLFTWFGQVV